MSSLCTKCFKQIQLNSISCNVCKCKYHRICANVEDDLAVGLEQCKNVVYNCENCLSTTSDLVSSVSNLTKEIKELKIIVSQLAEYNKNKLMVADDSVRSNDQTNVLLSSAPLSSSVSKAVNVAKPLTKQQRAAFADVVAGTSHKIKTKGNMDIRDPKDAVTDVLDDESDVFSTVNTETEAINTDWVTKRRRKRKPRKVLCIGENSNTELDVVLKKKWVHISSLKPSVSENTIIDYVSRHLNIGKEHLECFKLVKKDASLENLKYINFKLGISSDYYNDLLSPSLWPSNVRLRPFKFFPRPMGQNQKT